MRGRTVALLVGLGIFGAAMIVADPAAAAGGPLFTAGPASSLPGYANAMVSADFNGDGYFDVATTDYTNGEVDIELGSSNGTFTPAPGSPIELGTGVDAIATGEFGTDTHPDLIVANYAQDTVTILRNNGSGVFTPGTPISVGCTPLAIATGNFNSSSLYTDFAVTDSCGDVEVFLAGSNGSFPATPSATISLPGLTCGTPDPDGIVADSFGAGTGLDLAVLDGYNNEVEVLSNNGHGVFSKNPAYDTATGVAPQCNSQLAFVGAESLADVPVSGPHPDLAVGYQFNGDAQILVGGGSGKFTAGKPTSIAPGYTQVTNIVAGNFVGATPGIATSDYWQGGGAGTTAAADWVSVANIGAGGSLTPVAGSPYEIQGVIGALAAGAFADDLTTKTAGDDIVVNDGEGYQCKYYGLVTLVNHSPGGGPATPADVFSGDGCKIPPPAVSPNAPSNVTIGSAALNATITPTQGTTITSCTFEYGVGNYGTSAPCKLTATISGFSATLTVSKLKPTSKYQWRVVVSAGGSTVTADGEAFQTCQDTTINDGPATVNTGLQAVGCFLAPGGSSYTTTSQFRLNGIDFYPQAGTTFTLGFGGLSPSIKASGPGCMKVAISNPITHNPLLEITLQCWTGSMQVSLGGQVVTLHAGGFLDAGQGTFAGLLVDKVTLKLSAGFGAQLAASVGIGSVLGNSLLYGNLNAQLTNQNGLSVQQACIGTSPPTMVLPGFIKDMFVPIQSASLCYQPQLNILAGSLAIGAPGGLTLKGQIGIHLGLPPPGSVDVVSIGGAQLAYLRFGLNGLGVPIDESPFFLERLEGGVTFDPVLGFDGAVGISLLKQVKGFELLSLNGTGSIAFGGDDGFNDFFFSNDPANYFANPEGGQNYDTINLHGEAGILQTGNFAVATIARLDATIRTNGRLSTFSGDLDLPGIITAMVNGTFDGPHWTASGNGTWSEYGVSLSGTLYASDKGFAACGTLPVLFGTGPQVGFKDENGSVSFFLGCNFGDLNSIVSATNSVAGSSRTVRIPPRLKAVELAVRGTSGPPSVTLRGPGGELISSPPEPDKLSENGGALTLAEANNDTSYFEIPKPQSGSWTITPSAASSPIASVAIATPLTPPAVRATVRGTGDRSRRLGWRLHPAPGRSVLLIASGAHVWKLLVDTSRASGSISFDPADTGAPGTRHIIAIVEQDGAPLSRRTVAAYTAPAQARLASVRGLHAVRHHMSIKVSWKGVRGAGAYLLTFSLHGHQTDRVLVKASARSFTLTTALAGTVSLVAGGRGVRAGPASSARFAAQGATERRKPHKHKHG